MRARRCQLGTTERGDLPGPAFGLGGTQHGGGMLITRMFAGDDEQFNGSAFGRPGREQGRGGLAVKRRGKRWNGGHGSGRGATAR